MKLLSSYFHFAASRGDLNFGQRTGVLKAFFLVLSRKSFMPPR